MSDEEMARLFIIDKYGLRKDLEIFRIKQDEDLCKDFYAFIAGLKAGRPKWHDLRENPNDLPSRKGLETYSERLITDKGYSVYNFRKYRWYVDDPDCGCMVHTEIVAWCEIPKFEEVEELLEGK